MHSTHFMVTIKLEDNYYKRLMEYSASKNISVQEALQELIGQLELDNESDEEKSRPSWDQPLPQAIIDLLPKRKKGSLYSYEDYKTEKERLLRNDYESIP